MMETGFLTKDVGSILVGEEAVKHGILDEVGGIDRAIQASEDDGTEKGMTRQWKNDILLIMTIKKKHRRCDFTNAVLNSYIRKVRV